MQRMTFVILGISVLFNAVAGAQTVFEPTPPSAFFRVGAGVYFIKPHWDNNPEYGLFVNTPGARTYRQVDFDWDFEPAWDIWGEFVGAGGGGLRTRYWQFDHRVSDRPVLGNLVNEGIILPTPLGLSANVFGGPPPLQSYFESGLEMDVLDVEVVQRFGQQTDWSWELSGGLRWASIEQHYRGLLFNATGSFVTVEQEFNGIGPLLAVEGRRSFLGSRLSLFSKARGAILFGQANATGVLGRQVGPFVDATSSASNWDTLPVIELELGASFNQPLGPVTAFVEFAFVGSTWIGAGNTSHSGPLQQGAPAFLGSPQPLFSTSNNDTLGLIGGRLTGGLIY